MTTRDSLHAGTVLQRHPCHAGQCDPHAGRLSSADAGGPGGRVARAVSHRLRHHLHRSGEQPAAAQPERVHARSSSVKSLIP